MERTILRLLSFVFAPILTSILALNEIQSLFSSHYPKFTAFYLHNEKKLRMPFRCMESSFSWSG